MEISYISQNRKKNFFNFSLNLQILIFNVLFFVIFGILIWAKIIPIDFIALNPSYIFEGKYLWTFLTSIFMHAGIFHLIANMLSLIFVGSLIEKLLGKKRYFYFYLISGIFAGLLFVLSALIFKSDLNTYAVGASGALFGLIGLLIFLTPNLPVYLFFIPLPIKMKYAAPAMLILLWLISILGNLPVGNFAHLGGLIIGLVYGFYLKRKYPNKIKYLSKLYS
jgi:membrane associated rhomboid family serine protease